MLGRRKKGTFMLLERFLVFLHVCDPLKAVNKSEIVKTSRMCLTKALVFSLHLKMEEQQSAQKWTKNEDKSWLWRGFFHSRPCCFLSLDHQNVKRSNLQPTNLQPGTTTTSHPQRTMWWHTAPIRWYQSFTIVVGHPLRCESEHGDGNACFQFRFYIL